MLPRPILTGALIVGALTAASHADEGPTLSITIVPVFGPAHAISHGEHLDDAEHCGIQAAINMIKEWEKPDCGVSPPSNSLLPADPASEQLQGILNACKMYKDVVAKPGILGLTGVGDLEGIPYPGNPNETISETGAPGMSFPDHMIPKEDPHGTFKVPVPNSPPKCYRETAVAALAAVLLHELHHFNFPGELGDEATLEGDAHTYSAEQICKVIECDTTSSAVKGILCAALLQSNNLLWRNCLDQVPCEACDPMDVVIPFPKKEPEPKTPIVGGNPRRTWEPPTGFASLQGPGDPDLRVDSQVYTGGAGHGTVHVDRWGDTISIHATNANDTFTSVDVVVPRTLQFDLQDVAQLDGDRLLLLGIHSPSGLGTILEVHVDLVAETFTTPTVVSFGGAFGGSIDHAVYEVVPGSQVVFVLGHDKSIGVFAPAAGLFVPLVTVADAADLSTATRIDVFPSAVGPGFTALAHANAHDAIPAAVPTEPLTMVTDVNLDGIVDSIH